ncbi:hypothetical protein F5Y03DRAFT_364367 [Xylaria venustula]|nr:hypothetical protein F5Y03DRAFT_364367 [Xylaria venustula]
MVTATETMQSSAVTAHTQSSVTTATVREHACLFTHDLRRKQKRWQDGRLKYHTFNRRVMVYDERGNFVGDAHWREDYDLADGEDLELERGGVIVQVGDCVGSRDQDLSELVDKRAQERAQRQAAAAARRPPVATIAALHGLKSQSIPQKHLHAIIGTPSGHHGRAVLPKESPYEERQQKQLHSQSDDNRPAKRQRKDISPPSKSGYAQNLFGATLTLSGRPSSQTTTHNRSSRPMSDQLHDTQLSKKTFSRLHSSIRPEPSLETSESVDLSTSLIPRRERPWVLDRGEEMRDGHPVLNLQFTNQYIREPREVDEARERADIKISQRGKSSALGDLNKVHDKKRSSTGDNCTRDIIHRNPNTIDLTEDQVGTLEQPIHNEPRTELKIKPRKKRGLLMISERRITSGSLSKSEPIKIGLDDHAHSSSPKAQPGNSLGSQGDNRRRSADTQHDGTRFPGETHKNTAQRKRLNEEEGNEDDGHGGHQLSSTRHIEDERSNEMPCLDRLNSDLSKGPNLKSAARQSDTHTTDTSSVEVANGLRLTERPLAKDTISSDANEDYERLHSTGRKDNSVSMVDEMPAPRLARLGRRSIKSKEVIGFIFDDEPDPAVSVTQDEPAPEEPSSDFQSDRDIDKQYSMSNTKVYDGLVTIGRRLDAEPRPSRKRLLVVQEPRNSKPETPNNEPSPAVETEEASSTSIIAATKQLKPPISNPATRGKKAAKPSDAAGQMPICPLPVISVENSLHQSPKMKNVPKNSDEGAASTMPGFSRANGGPWSREAHDLFDFKRPS